MELADRPGPGADAETALDRRFGLRLDLLVAWLRSLGVPIEEPVRLDRIGAGKSNITLRLGDARGTRLVLRRPPLGHLLESAHDITREAGILDRLAGTDVPTPTPVGLCRDPRVSDVALLVMEHLPGHAIDGPEVVAEFSSEARRATAHSLIAALNAVHGLDLAAVGLDALSRRGNYAERQLKRWLRQSRSTRLNCGPEVESIAELLAGSTPADGPTTLVHGDFHLMNAMFDPAGGAVTGILDWELTTLGSPLADLGTLLAYWSRRGGAILGSPFDVTALPGFLETEEIIELYARSSSFAVESVVFWQALAFWKLAVIVAGVVERRANAAENPGGFDEETVAGLLGCAREILESRRAL